MTTEEIKIYYANLLILEYLGRARAYAMCREFPGPFIMDQLPVTVQNAFCVGNQTIAGTVYPGAVGDQLDVLGKYANVTRSGYDLNGNPIILGDLDYTSLIKIAIITNSAGSSLATIQQLLNMYFPGQIFAYDGADMQMSYLITAAVGGQDLVQLFITKNLLPKPMGVELASIVYIISISLFGFQTYVNPAPDYNPATTYAFGALSFADGIVYQSLISDNLNNPVSDTAAWVVIVYPFNSYATYPTVNPYTFLSYQDSINIL